tara:strand:+ start:986 stop:1357 length:372 start_codon:yes stop_codon:yes gene_type:complete
MKEVIKSKVLAKNWTFNEITNLKQSVVDLSREIYLEMFLLDRFEMLRDIEITNIYVGYTFTDAIKQAVIASLQGEVAEAISELLNTATIEFGGNKNENTESSLGGESHKKLTPNEAKINNEEE